MLVLSRKKNEGVEIGGGINCGGTTVRVVEIRGDKVRLGFEAPVDMRILRREICGKPMGRHGGRKPDPQ